MACVWSEFGLHASKLFQYKRHFFYAFYLVNVRTGCVFQLCCWGIGCISIFWELFSHSTVSIFVPKNTTEFQWLPQLLFTPWDKYLGLKEIHLKRSKYWRESNITVGQWQNLLTELLWINLISQFSFSGPMTDVLFWFF